MTAAPIRPIPDGGVLLHVGMFKTGTTAAQGMFAAARDRLLEQGVLYPPAAGNSHRVPACAVVEHRPHKDKRVPPIAEWDALVETIRSSSAPRTLLSSEFFSHADDPHAQRILDDFGADHVHIAITVRNLAEVAVSMWQQTLKRGWVSSLDDWLARSFERGDDGVTGFWRRHDPSLVAERWARLLGGDRVHVIVVDRHDRNLLPSAFEQLLDVEPGTVSSAEVGHTNRGMTAVEAELVRRLNSEIRRDLKKLEYRALVREAAVWPILVNRVPPKSEPRLRPPQWVVDQAVDEGRRVAEALTSAGVHVIGTLGGLTDKATADDAAPPTSLDVVPLDLAVDALVGAVNAGAAKRREADRLATDRARTRRSPVDQLSAAQLAGLLARRTTAHLKPRR